MKSSLYNKREFPRYDMIVFCHLRWDFVYQRPQHLISRLARQYKILVVEEPVGKSYRNGEITEISDSLHILKPHIDHLDRLGSYLKAILKDSKYLVGWFYSAAFVSVLNTFDFETVVYDCMDELSLFKGASLDLLAQENSLFSAADIVFTGGKSLYESKKEKHHNVFCFPSSVDVAHFSTTETDSVVKPTDLMNIKSPIIGYYGVIDERIDLNLLQETALQSPDASFVMIGPICKIEENDLPRAENIHYLGMKSYEELPQYLYFFDIAMMPFALNDSTKFISPTKTLEYMAAMKPIISTKIKDVVREYSACVSLVYDADEFCNAIAQPMTDFESQYEQILENTSWDRTAEKMAAIINKVLA